MKRQATPQRIALRPSAGSGWWIGGCGAVALVIGLAKPSAALIALGLVLLAATAVLFVLLRRGFEGLRVDRELPESSYEGAAVDVDIQVENTSSIPVFFPYIEEVFHPEVHSQRRLLFPGLLEPGETVELPYVGHCLAPRGVYGVGPAALMVSDPLGFFRRAKSFTSAAGIKVFPPFGDPQLREQVGSVLLSFSEEEGRDGRGRSDEFYKVREYQPGDSHRLIHWRMTAHLGYPVIREHTQSSASGMTIFFDTHASSVVGEGRNSSFEAAIKLTAGLAERTLTRGRRVQFFVAGPKERDLLHELGNAGEYRRFLDTILYLQPDRRAVSFPELLDRSARRVQAHSTIVVTVSPYLFDDQRLADRLIQWKRGGHRVVAIVFGEFVDGRGRTHVPNLDAAQVYARRMMASGIETILFSCGTRLRPVAQERTSESSTLSAR